MDRVCKTCGESKPIECFAYQNGHQCKDCYREYNREYNRQWRKRNKERISEYNKHYRVENKDAIKEYRKEYMKRYYKRNKEIIAKSHKQWYKKNPGYNKKYYLDPDNKERKTKTNKRWKINNPEKVRLYGVNRKAAQRGASGSFRKEDILTIYEKQRGLCFYCGASLKDNYHIDHFIPLSKGGTNYPSNLRLACQACNLMKNNRVPQEFLQTEFLRLF